MNKRGPTIERKKKESKTVRGGPGAIPDNTTADPFHPRSLVTLSIYIYSVFAKRKAVENERLLPRQTEDEVILRDGLF